MGDFRSEIFKKYGTAAVVFAILFAFFIWLLAHFTAAPGGTVSVLWGLFKYNKDSNVLENLKKEKANLKESMVGLKADKQDLVNELLEKNTYISQFESKKDKELQKLKANS